MSERLRPRSAAFGDFVQLRRQFQRLRLTVVVREENHRRAGAEVHRNFSRQRDVGFDEFRFRKQNRADFKRLTCDVRRRIVRANQRVGEGVQFLRETVRQHTCRLSLVACPYKKNIFREPAVVGLRLKVFVVQEIIRPTFATEIRPQLRNGNFAVDVNQFAFRISFRAPKIHAAIVDAAQRKVEVHVKIFFVVGD